MTCACVAPDVAQLQAQLAEERLARQLAEARLEGFCRALTLLSPGRAVLSAGGVADTAGDVLSHMAREAGNGGGRHTSRSVTGQRHSVTASVTQEEREERKREKGRVRTQSYRIRKRSVTGQRHSVTASVTPLNSLSSPPPPVTVDTGTLRVVSEAAREARQAGPRVYATKATLPPEVRELQVAWDELVAPHGFDAWPERTSPELLRDARAALERRPMAEWRKVFGLVPRSPVCRGELKSGQRASLVWLLAGRCWNGYRPEEKLLGGGWTVDRQPTDTERLQEPLQASLPLPLPSGATSAQKSWRAILEALARARKDYALNWLSRLAPVGEVAGRLLLACPDVYFREWVEDMYRELLTQQAREVGLEGVELVLEGTAEGQSVPTA